MPKPYVNGLNTPTITIDSWDEDTSNGIVIVEVHSDDCNHSKSMRPIIKEVADTYSDMSNVTVTDFRLESMQDKIKIDFIKGKGIFNLPSFLCYRNGKCIATIAGVQSRDDLVNLFAL